VSKVWGTTLIEPIDPFSTSLCFVAIIPSKVSYKGQIWNNSEPQRWLSQGYMASLPKPLFWLWPMG
jgi:hypothetical protein